MIDQDFITEFRVAQKEHVLDLSRTITIGLGNTVEEDCPNCSYDGVSGSSGASFTNFTGTITLFSGTTYEKTFEAKSFKQRCPICGGKGYFSIPNEKPVKAHVHWIIEKTTLPSSPAGKSGQTTVKIKADSLHYSDFLNAKYFIIDGVTVEPSSVPVIRSMQVADGIVEMFCQTISIGKETNK